MKVIEMDARLYGPSNNYYLTPEQRRKLREIRERKEFSSPIENEHNASQNYKLTCQKTKKKGSMKAKVKIQKKKLVKKEIIKPFISEIVDGTVSNENYNYCDDKKFFKNRSPNHLKKISKKETLYVASFIKRSRLDFTQRKCTTSDSEQFSKNSDDSLNQSSESISDISSLSNTSGISFVYGDTSNFEELNFSVNSDNCNKSVVEQNHGLDDMMDTNESDKSIGKSGIGLEQNQKYFKHNIDSCEVLSLNSNEQRKESEINAESDKEQNEKSCVPTNDNSQLTNLNINPTSTQKFYPLFYSNKVHQNKTSTLERKGTKKAFTTKDTSKGNEQMIIDAGQKHFGAKQCSTCRMFYTIGHAEDEHIHAKHHDKYLVNLKFPGWKDERVVGQYYDGRVIQVLETDRNFKAKKIQDILIIANNDLGFSSPALPVRPNINIFFFISNDKRVRGCLIAESITCASPVVLSGPSNASEDGKVIWKLGSWYASSESVPAICGINRIWVDKEYRRRKVASKLVDCLRSNFIFGHVVSMGEFAFTDPTPDGREFAAKYTGTDNFLVYK